MKNKGFTLIELLAVIIVLSVIMLIVIVAVGPTLDKSGKSLSKRQKENMVKAAEAYFIKEGMDKINEDNQDEIFVIEISINRKEYCINISTLNDKGYIDKETVRDPDTRDVLTGSVHITESNNMYSYEYDGQVCTQSNE